MKLVIYTEQTREAPHSELPWLLGGTVWLAGKAITTIWSVGPPGVDSSKRISFAAKEDAFMLRILVFKSKEHTRAITFISGAK